MVLLRAGTLSETDTFWEVRTGLLAIAKGSLPAADPFSWTVNGQPWTLNSWGFDVLAALAYRAAGLPAVALACAGMAAAAFGLVLLQARVLGARAPVASAAVLLVSPLLIAWLSARPQLVDYIAVPALVLLLQRLVAGRAGLLAVAGVGALTAAWVNLHAAALLGVAVTGVVTGLVLVRRSTRARGGWCAAALGVSAVCSFLNPYGAGLFAQTAQVQDSSAGVVTEWQHIDPADPAQMTMLALGLVALAIALRQRDVVSVGALGVAAAGSLGAIRILPILLLLALPVLAASASQPLVRRSLRRWRAVVVPAAAAGLSAVAVMAFLGLGHLGQPSPDQYSSAVVDAIPSGCRLFNSYALGGFVLLERPDVEVSLDSRNDLYGPTRVLADQRILEGEGDTEQGLAGAGCVLIPPGTALGGYLAHSKEWERTARDSAAELFVRRQPALSSKPACISRRVF